MKRAGNRVCMIVCENLIIKSRDKNGNYAHKPTRWGTPNRQGGRKGLELRIQRLPGPLALEFIKIHDMFLTTG